jgi:prolyl oligopeptidase
VLYVRNTRTGETRVLVDPNTVDASGLTALDWWWPSPDGALLAFGTSERGDEWSTLQVLEVESGQLRPDRIPRARYSTVAWLPDGSGFYYTRYPEPGSVPPGQENYNRHAFYHEFGTDPAGDPKIFGEGRSPQDMIELTLSENGRWLVASAFQGWVRSEVYVRDLAANDSDFVPVVEGKDALFQNPKIDGDRLLLLTNLDAPNYRIVAIDLPDGLGAEPDTWKSVVAERAARVIDGFTLAGGEIVTDELERASSRLRRYGLDGSALGELDLPGLGSVAGIAGEPDNRTIVVGYTSFAVPARLLSYDLDSGERSVFAALPPAPGFDPNKITVEQVTYPSKDGTAITMFLVARADLPRDAVAPTILTGYGGFNISRTPGFLGSMIAWIERGGRYALPNLRGGGEYGEAWHQAGMRGRKQNVFDDFHAAAEWLIAQGLTDPDHLGIAGGSNGGLLMGAAITQRPELFRAVYCAVPLLDMVRYDEFSIAKLWVPEYGSATDPDAFQWLYAYSPYHHVEAGKAYPAILFTTAEQDSRVDPLHARKMTALMQHTVPPSGERPILLHVERDAGHGVGKPLHKRVAEAADQLGFFAMHLGLRWED